MSHFIKGAVNPLIRLVSEAMTEWLGPMFTSEGENIKVGIEPAVADDEDMKVKWVEMLAQQGAISNAELRAIAPLGLEGEGQAAIEVSFRQACVNLLSAFGIAGCRGETSWRTADGHKEETRAAGAA